MHAESKIEIVTAGNAELFEKARLLFTEYAGRLDIDLRFQSLGHRVSHRGGKLSAWTMARMKAEIK